MEWIEKLRVGVAQPILGCKFLLVSMVLACVAIPSLGGIRQPTTFWRLEPDQGPLLIGDQRAKMYIRCSLIPNFMSGGPCEEAFEDHHENKLIWTDVQEEIDAYLKKSL